MSVIYSVNLFGTCLLLSGRSKVAWDVFGVLIGCGNVLVGDFCGWGLDIVIGFASGAGFTSFEDSFGRG